MGGVTAEVSSPTVTRQEGRHVALSGLTLVMALPVLVLSGDGFRDIFAAPVESLAWAVFIAVANLLTVPIEPSSRIQASLGAPITISAAVVLAPAHTALLVLTGSTHPNEWRRGTGATRIVFNRVQFAVCALAASAAAAAVPGAGVTELITDTVVAVVVFNLVNAVALATAWVAMGYGTLTDAAQESRSPFQVDFGLVSLLAVLVVVSYQTIGVAAVLLVALPLWLGYNALRSYQSAEARAVQLSRQVAELERLNTNLRDLQLARERLSSQILVEGARERSRIALDLHDVVLPYLAAAEIQADNVLSAIGRGNDEVAGRLALTTRESVHSAIASLRQTFDAISSQTVSPGELRAHIDTFTGSLQSAHGLRPLVSLPEHLPQLPIAVELLVLDALRGLLANVTRHANARHVEVSLEVERGVLRLLVTDDGTGFNPHDGIDGSSGHGLQLLQQRVSLTRGTVRIESAPGEGTTVTVELPL